MDKARALSRLNTSAGRKEVGVGFRKASLMKINNLMCFFKSLENIHTDRSDCDLLGRKSVAEVAACFAVVTTCFHAQLSSAVFVFDHSTRFRWICHGSVRQHPC